MAAGYDARQSGRDSFAFAPTAPVQGGTGRSGNSQGIQLVGGQSRGEGVLSGPQTDAGANASQLGSYFTALMAPAVEKRQQEQFFEGFVAAQSGIALDELDNSNKGLNRIFGPSSFEEGAQFYTAKKQVSDWSNELLADSDALKRMTPAEAAKVIAAKSVGMMTGHTQADQIIQAEIMKNTGPVLNTIAKERYVWQQEEAVAAVSSAAHSQALSLQNVMVAQGALSDPSDIDVSAMDNSLQTFRQGMMQPDGMDDDSYKSFLYNFSTKAMQDGNFYAVEAMRRSGVTGVFNDEENKKLEDAYTRYSNKAVGRAAGEFAPDLMTLDARIAMEQISPQDAVAELARINEQIKRRTGVTEDLFDYDDMRDLSKGVVGVAVASLRRAEARGWQLEDRQFSADQRAAERAEDAASEGDTAAQTSTVWAVGGANTGIASGMKAGDFDILALAEYRSGSVTNIVKNYQQEGWVSTRTAEVMQARVTSTLGDAYTKDTEKAYTEWGTMYKASPSAAAAYYGPHHQSFQRFDSLVRGGTSPNAAYQRSFGDPTIHGSADIPAERRKEATEAVEAHVSGMGTTWYNPTSWGNYNLNTSSRSAVSGAIGRQVAINAKNSDRPTASLVPEAIEQATANGSLEQAGQFAWSNRPGTQPLHRLMGVQKAAADKAFMSVLDDDLKKAGYSDGAYGDDYEVTRVKAPNGEPLIVVRAMQDGDDVQVLIPMSKLKAYTNNAAGREVRGNQPRARNIPLRGAGGNLSR